MSQITADLLEKEISELEVELSQLEPKRQRLVLFRELLKHYKNGDTQGEMKLDVAPGEGKFSKLGTTEGILSFLSFNPANFFTPREIADGLVAGGFKAVSENFITTVHTTCKRKAESGALEVGEKSGSKVYRIKAK